jgi:hypothetical protein
MKLTHPRHDSPLRDAESALYLVLILIVLYVLMVLFTPDYAGNEAPGAWFPTPVELESGR